MKRGRTPLIAANWKMNTTPSTAVQLATDVATRTTGMKGVLRVLCPPAVSLQAVRQAVAGTGVLTGVQNVYFKDSGAFTGETSVEMVQALAEYVIVGHSERRKLFGETDADVAAKAQAVAARRLRPIMCVGESLDVRKSGRVIEFVQQQVRAGLAGFTGWSYLVVAYEPVWAIGSGEAATPEQAQEICRVIREEVRSLAGKEPIDGTPVLYGGSVTGDNVGPFLDRPDVDGALVGSASLKADEFARIVQTASRIAAT